MSPSSPEVLDVALEGATYRFHSFRGEGPPLLALHGFTGSGLDFEGIASKLHRTVLAPDLPGHGGSTPPASPEDCSMERVSLRILEALERLGLPTADVLGYSMGGRLALHLVQSDPERFRALVLVGASPGLADPAERLARRKSDELLAGRIREIGVEAFLAEWAARPLIASQSRISAPWRDRMRVRRLANRAEGLALSLEGMGTGSMPSLWGALPALACAGLLLTGAEDVKFTGIAQAMLQSWPRAEHRVIQAAGHCPHLEQPEASLGAIRAFLAEAERAGERGPEAPESTC